MEVQGLILAVMHAKHLGPKSRWAGYLGFLPEDLTHMPMMWKESDLAELRGTSTLDLLEGRVLKLGDAPSQVLEAWQQIALPFIKQNPALTLPAGAEGYRLFQWCTAIVASYSFTIGDDLFQAMIPYFDALNHVTGMCNVRKHHEEGKKRKGGVLQLIATKAIPKGKLACGVLQLIATKAIPKGSEVVNNFQEGLTNSQLLLCYGFVEPHNTRQAAQLPLLAVLGACRSTTLPSTQTQQQQQQQRQQRQRQPTTTPSTQTLPNSTSAALDAAATTTEKKTGTDTTVFSWTHRNNDATAATTGDSASATEPTSGHDTTSPTMHHTAPAASTPSVGDDEADLANRVEFCREHGLIDKRGVFDIPHSQHPPGALVETVRLLLLPPPAFRAFASRVDAWQVPNAPMLSDPRSSDLPSDLGQVLCQLGQTALSRFPSTPAKDRKRIAQLQSSDPTLQAAVMVRVAEMECFQCLVNAGDSEGGALLALAAQTWVRPWKEGKKRRASGSN
ncbi:MAG: hypothetical protein WDW36_005946 [Sanguina aurantia]